MVVGTGIGTDVVWGVRVGRSIVIVAVSEFFLLAYVRLASGRATSMWAQSHFFLPLALSTMADQISAPKISKFHVRYCVGGVQHGSILSGILILCPHFLEWLAVALAGGMVVGTGIGTDGVLGLRVARLYCLCWTATEECKTVRP